MTRSKAVDLSTVPRSKRSLNLAAIVATSPKPKSNVSLPSISSCSIAPFDDDGEEDDPTQEHSDAETECSDGGDDEHYAFGIDHSVQMKPFRHVTTKFLEAQQWERARPTDGSLCQLLCDAYHKVPITQMRDKNTVMVELVAITVSVDYNWTIVGTQLNDVFINFCSRRITPGQVFRCAVNSQPFTGRQRSIFHTEHKVQFVDEQTQLSSVSPLFTAKHSSFIVTVQRIASKVLDSNHHFLVSDATGQYAVLQVPTDHHDLTRLMAFGNRQKIIVTNVACTSSDSHGFISSLTDDNPFFVFDFRSYSRIRLPLDDFNRSLLNVLPGKVSLPDGESEHWRGQRYPRVTITTTITAKCETGYWASKLNGISQLKLVTMEKLELGKTYTLDGAHSVVSSVLHIDEWTQIADA